jgi:hypothetical protein
LENQNVRLFMLAKSVEHTKAEGFEVKRIDEYSPHFDF